MKARALSDRFAGLAARWLSKLDPVLGVTRVNYAISLIAARQYAAAIVQGRRGVEMLPEWDGAHGWLSMAYLGGGQFDSAAIRVRQRRQRADPLEGAVATRSLQNAPDSTGQSPSYEAGELDQLWLKWWNAVRSHPRFVVAVRRMGVINLATALPAQPITRSIR
jgi:hypothetical protein